ncbi:hypothetical protein CCAN12_480009 [Capnocytophaga canimorsus]|uniref:Uncharacterized protein n=1 Tax=Capnocytophaga canimorsus TaxID=28188 RepID=A0A0B7H7H0_9FLAO|nr:hypothetical protein CCAN12_480009 [Capnocytophaga canimorsus]
MLCDRQRHACGLLTSNRSGGVGKDDIYSFMSVYRYIFLYEVDAWCG